MSDVPPHGFSPSILVNRPVDEKFICTLCKHMLRSPLQSFCGHRFCKACVEYYLRGKDQEVCPSCKSDCDDSDEYSFLKLDQMFPDNAIKRDYISVQVQCPNNGCAWQGSLRLYEEHEPKCDFLQIQCALCKKFIGKNQQEQHDQEECEERPWSCPYCKKNMKMKYTKSHLEICSEVPLDCDICGTKGIKRAELHEHYHNQCKSKEKMVVCPIQRCFQVLPEAQLSRHLESDVVRHIQIINTGVQTLQQAVDDVESRAAAATVPMGLSQGEQAGMSVNALQKQVQNLALQGNSVAQQLGSGAVGSGEAQSEVTTKLALQDKKINTYESVAAVLNTEILKCLKKIEDLAKRFAEDQNGRQSVNSRIANLEQLLQAKEQENASLRNRLDNSETTFYDGVLVWRVDNVAKKRQDARSGVATSIYSPPFYTSRLGYKMCARLYLHGDGMGRGTHLSLYFVIMKGRYDPLLRWPFRQKVTLMLLDLNKREHILDAFKPDPSSNSFKQPVSDMNIASGCPLFCPLNVLDPGGSTKEFVKNDTLFLKIMVDTSDL